MCGQHACEWSIDLCAPLASVHLFVCVSVFLQKSSWWTDKLEMITNGNVNGLKACSSKPNSSLS